LKLEEVKSYLVSDSVIFPPVLAGELAELLLEHYPGEKAEGLKG